jgi:tRNA threonylcarbamoyl adenosine modification protein YjeE
VLLAPLLRAGDILLLEGELGAGKTELARALLRSRAGRPIEVPSPTFTLVQIYELPDLRIAHADLYRLSGPEELDELGLDELAQEGALIVEWPERAGGLFMGELLRVRLLGPFPGQADAREVELVPTPGWDRRLREAGL